MNNKLNALNLLMHGFETTDFHVFKIQGKHGQDFCINLLLNTAYIHDSEKGTTLLYVKTWTLESIKQLYELIFRNELVRQTHTNLTKPILLYLGFITTEELLVLKKDFHSAKVQIKASLYSDNLGVFINRFNEGSVTGLTTILAFDATLQNLIQFCYAFTNLDIDETLDNVSINDFLYNIGFRTQGNFIWNLNMSKLSDNYTFQYNIVTRTVNILRDNTVLHTKTNIFNIRASFEKLYAESCEYILNVIKKS